MVDARPGRPPGPKGAPLTGNTIRYDRDRLGFLQAAIREYGDCFSFDPSTIVVNDPAVVHDIFMRTNTDFLAEGELFAEALDLDELAGTVHAWMQARRQGWRGFHRAVASAHADRLVAALDRTLRACAGAAIDVNERMRFFSGVAVADYCLGADAAGVPEAIAANVSAVLPLLDSSTTLPSWVPTRRQRRYLAARRGTSAILSRAIRERRSAGYDGAHRDLLDQLLEVDEPRLTDTQIYHFLRVNLVASFGVPGAALSWIVWELHRRPDIRQRVEQESRQWGERPGVVPALADLPYVEALVKEVLRAYPPTWLMGRLVARATTVAGFQLHPGDHVMFSPYLIHRDPRLWTDPDRIDPDRWLGGTAPHPRYAYIPFGAGPRVCLGTSLGLLQLVLATSWLVHAYDVEVVGEPVAGRSPKALLTPEGLRARFTPRLAAPWSPAGADQAMTAP